MSGRAPSDAGRAALVDRLRDLLAGEPSTREVPMFGGRSFLVNDKIVVSAGRGGDLLVRVPTDDHDALQTRPGASQAVMGADRDMGPGWVSVVAVAIAADADLGFWLDLALDHNRAVTATG